MPLYRLHEVASYFPHYQLKPPAAVEVRSLPRYGLPSAWLGRLPRSAADPGRRNRRRASARRGSFLLGPLRRAPAVSINDHVYWNRSLAELESLVRDALAGQPLPAQAADMSPLDWQIDPYKGEPRYDVIRRLIEAWKADPDTDVQRKRVRLSDPVLKELETAHLRGMGGAAFPTFKKWTIVRNALGRPKYSVCNGDESEPGTFKDRELLRRARIWSSRGCSSAGLVTGAARGWIFIRHEYQAGNRRRCAGHWPRPSGRGSRREHLGLRAFPIRWKLFVSPGGYICGEETALLEALEDRRAEPRNKPPLMSLEGLFGKPTSMNNVETFSWVPAILTHGGDWYRDQGTSGATGLRLIFDQRRRESAGRL